MTHYLFILLAVIELGFCAHHAYTANFQYRYAKRAASPTYTASLQKRLWLTSYAKLFQHIAYLIIFGWLTAQF